MKPIIRCASMMLFVFSLVNGAQAQTQPEKPAKDSVEIYRDTATCSVIVTSLQEVTATAFQDASTVSMDSDIHSSAQTKPGSIRNILPSYIRQIRIYDIAGTIRKTLNFNDSASTQVNVNLSDLAIGSYFIETTVNQKTLDKQRIIIER